MDSSPQTGVPAEPPLPDGTQLPAKGRLSHMGRALQNRDYRLFLAGQMVSLPGTWMQSVAQSWLVFRLTGSTVDLGLVGFASQLPYLFVSLWGGRLADRLPKRSVILATQLFSMALAAALATLTLTGLIQSWHIIWFALALGIINAFDLPARQSILIELVGRDDLPNAIALNSSVFNLARLAGPAIGGLIVALAGEGWCFAINAVSYVAPISALLLMRAGRTASGSKGGKAIAEIAEGFAYVRANPPLAALIFGLAITGFFGMPYGVLLPVFADDIFHAGPTGLGTLMAAMGSGAVIGALFLAARKSAKGLSGVHTRGAWILGLSLIAFSWAPNFWLAALFMLPAGYAQITHIAGANTLMQLSVPDHLRGRVSSIYSMMFLGMTPFGALAAGAAAHVIGAPLTVAMGGVIVIVTGFLLRRRIRLMEALPRGPV